MPLPKYERYKPEFADLADAVRRNRPLAVTAAEEQLVQQWLIRACR